MSIKLYGIKQCDTIRKAKRWLDQRGVEYQFHDFREHGLDPMSLRLMVSALGWQKLLNKRSTTWRALPDLTRENMDELLAIAVMEDQPVIIKRPVLELDGEFHTGFSEKDYAALFPL